jgi:hypothetical protein
MGVRPPPSGNGDEPETVTFGIAALDARLEEAGVRYPIDAGSVVRELGDPEVPYDANGSSVALSEALEETHIDRFETEQELLNALHPVFERYRERSAGGLLAQLRSLFPF